MPYKLQERFWHEEEVAEGFYRAIENQIVVYNIRTKTFRKPTLAGAIFNLSPTLLLQAVREECHTVLKRDRFYSGQAIDFECLFTLV